MVETKKSSQETIETIHIIFTITKTTTIIKSVLVHEINTLHQDQTPKVATITHDSTRTTVIASPTIDLIVNNHQTDQILIIQKDLTQSTYPITTDPARTTEIATTDQITTTKLITKTVIPTITPTTKTPHRLLTVLRLHEARKPGTLVGCWRPNLTS